MKSFCQAIILSLWTLFSLINTRADASATGTAITEKTCWILFDSKASEAPVRLSERSLQRRQTKSAMEISCWYDCPVDDKYIETIRQTGAKIRHISRWLNAVSVEAPQEVINEISKLSFVKNIKRVSSHKIRKIPEDRILESISTQSLFDYGPSLNQVAMLGVDSLHNLGYSGAGVIIGIMDTGFDYSHICFSDIVSQNRILATYDFINGDTNVTDGEDIQRNHGTGFY